VTQQGEVGSYTFEILWVVSTTLVLLLCVYYLGALYTLDSVFDPVVYVKVMVINDFGSMKWFMIISYGKRIRKKYILFIFRWYVDGMVFLEEFDCCLRGRMFL